MTGAVLGLMVFLPSTHSNLESSIIFELVLMNIFSQLLIIAIPYDLALQVNSLGFIIFFENKLFTLISNSLSVELMNMILMPPFLFGLANNKNTSILDQASLTLFLESGMPIGLFFLKQLALVPELPLSFGRRNYSLLFESLILKLGLCRHFYPRVFWSIHRISW